MGLQQASDEVSCKGGNLNDTHVITAASDTAEVSAQKDVLLGLPSWAQPDKLRDSPQVSQLKQLLIDTMRENQMLRERAEKEKNMDRTLPASKPTVSEAREDRKDRGGLCPARRPTRFAPGTTRPLVRYRERFPNGVNAFHILWYGLDKAREMAEYKPKAEAKNSTMVEEGTDADHGAR